MLQAFENCYQHHLEIQYFTLLEYTIVVDRVLIFLYKMSNILQNDMKKKDSLIQLQLNTRLAFRFDTE